ncbi:uncharacterized protein K02A2.6-like [Eupeodes corollae]|uniref:uncharacterized protein K02A2.6-like n=1 Tax=Eupeodes corollae TaxID=290404 RepID=UPI002490C708|nr:uncharacterized protein K02A2.6-like [Eupeodes corollae]
MTQPPPTLPPRSSAHDSLSYMSTFTTSILPLDLKSTNMPVAWKNWYAHFQIFLRASSLDSQSDQRKVALLLHHMGPESLEIFHSFDLNLDTVKFDELVERLKSYFLPKVNIAMERHKFFTRNQRVGETIDEYVTALKNLSLSCEFDTIREDLVRDIFVCGLNNNWTNIKERLLNEGNIKLQKALDIAKTLEVTKDHTKQLQQCELTNTINVIKRFPAKKNSNSQSNSFRSNKYSHTQNTQKSKPNAQYNQNPNSYSSNSTQKNCPRCGEHHRYRCPAIGVKCNTCKKHNHFSKMCRFNKTTNSKSAYVRNVDADEGDGEDNALFLGSLEQSIKTPKNIWIISLKTMGHVIDCQIDTGAQANVMSLYQFNQIRCSSVQLTSSSTRVMTFSGEQLAYSKNVLDINSSKSVSCKSILENYSEVFSGLGLLKNKCHLKLQTNITPTIDCPRKIPFALKDLLKEELDRMENLKVILKVEEPTEWVNSIVLVKKANGKLRICLDPRNLNKAILRAHFVFPNIDEIKSKLSGSKYFSTLDANSGFWVIPLDDESSKLCTFITPFGRYRFLRLPFGINAAPEIFHAEMIKHFSDIDGVEIYIDDFFLHAATLEEHNIILQKVLQRAREIGLKFNKEKSKICLNEVKFIGYIFNQHGVRPDDSKVKAICEMSRPTSVSELQRFLGMVTYLGSFVKDLSVQNINLRQLLKKEVAWHWTDAHEKEFNMLKTLISTAPILTFYDPNKIITLSVDASKGAVGAVISHDNSPIAYASATLTSSQQNYAQIEKELFAILFGCIKFHQYIYGKRVIVETDHKPLVPLFTRALYKVPARLQRFMLRLQSYDLQVVYKPGKYMYTADTLSRAPLSEKTLTEFDNDLTLHCNLLISMLSVSQERLQKIKEASNNDDIFSKVKKYIKIGWPNDKKSVIKECMPYYKIKDELHVIDDILLKSNRIVISSSMRKEVLKLIHEGHLGIQRCQGLAKDIVFWPNINNDIQNIVTDCETCMRHRSSQPKEPLQPHEIQPIPWYKVGTDLFEFNKQIYLLVVDYWSKYIEIENLNSGYSSQFVISKLKAIFARHGIPQIMISDNGPPYNSEHFKNFCHDWQIEHITSSPYLPRSNGLAERSIQTIKKLLIKCKESGTDPYVSLLHYRTISKGNLPSPSELLMSRKLRTKIPAMSENYLPKSIDCQEVEKELKNNNEKSKALYDKTSKSLKPLNKGQKVHYKKTPTSYWTPGIVINKCQEPKSYIIEDNQDAFDDPNTTPSVNVNVQSNGPSGSCIANIDHTLDLNRLKRSIWEDSDDSIEDPDYQTSSCDDESMEHWVDPDYVAENSSDSENENVLVTAGGTETDGVNQEKIVTINIVEVEKTNPGQAAESDDDCGRLKLNRKGLSAKEKQRKRRENE